MTFCVVCASLLPSPTATEFAELNEYHQFFVARLTEKMPLAMLIGAIIMRCSFGLPAWSPDTLNTFVHCCNRRCEPKHLMHLSPSRFAVKHPEKYWRKTFNKISLRAAFHSQFLQSTLPKIQYIILIVHVFLVLLYIQWPVVGDGLAQDGSTQTRFRSAGALDGANERARERIHRE